MKLDLLARLAGLTTLSCLVVGWGTASGGRRLPDPPLPYADWGACPFECCTYGGWVARKATPVRPERTRRSATMFQIAGRESVVGDTGLVITRRCGLAVALRAGMIRDATLAVAVWRFNIAWLAGLAYRSTVMRPVRAWPPASSL